MSNVIHKPAFSSAKHTTRTGKVSRYGGKSSKKLKSGTPSHDIRRFFISSNRQNYRDYKKEGGKVSEMVSDKFDDGMEQIVINYPMYIDRGPILFSLDDFGLGGYLFTLIDASGIERK